MAACEASVSHALGLAGKSDLIASALGWDMSPFPSDDVNALRMGGEAARVGGITERTTNAGATARASIQPAFSALAVAPPRQRAFDQAFPAGLGVRACLPRADRRRPSYMRAAAVGGALEAITERGTGTRASAPPFAYSIAQRTRASRGERRHDRARVSAVLDPRSVLPGRSRAVPTGPIGEATP